MILVDNDNKPRVKYIKDAGPSAQIDQWKEFHDVLQNGAKAFSDRDDFFAEIPSSIRGMKFIRLPQRHLMNHDKVVVSTIGQVFTLTETSTEIEQLSTNWIQFRKCKYKNNQPKIIRRTIKNKEVRIKNHANKKTKKFWLHEG